MNDDQQRRPPTLGEMDVAKRGLSEARAALARARLNLGQDRFVLARTPGEADFDESDEVF
jgi:hypothetical protein